MEKGFSLHLPKLDEMSVNPPSRDDEYVRIAQEIRDLSPTVVESLVRIILELQKTHRSHCYMACKKWLAMHAFYAVDLGYVGIADRFYFGRIAPCDIVIYGTEEKLKTDDLILHVLFLSEHAIHIQHLKVIRMYAQGVLDLEDEKHEQYTVPTGCVIGKLLKVIPFNTPEWHELVMEMVNKPWLENKLEKAIVHYGNISPPETEKLKELTERLRIIRAK